MPRRAVRPSKSLATLALLLAAALARASSGPAPLGALDAEKAGRRTRAAEAAGDDTVLLVLSPAAVDGVADTARNADYEYLSPARAKEAAILLAHAKPDGEAPRVDRLYLRPRSPAMERWTGPEPGPGEETAAATAFTEVRALASLSEDVAAALRGRKTLLVSAGPATAGGRALGAVLDAVRTRIGARQLRLVDGPGGTPDPLFDAARRAAPELAATDAKAAAAPATDAVEVRLARTLIGTLREVKSAAEVDAIRRATAATMAGHADAMRAVRPGLFEYHLAALVELRCRAGGCARQAYPSIAGAGPNSCVLHYDRNVRRLEEGDLIVLDAGGEYEGYACDVTRTFPASGRFTEEQAAVYDAVLEAQEKAVAAVRPGVTLRQVHDVAWKVLEARGLSKWFIHGTCHSVGLEVHDAWRKDAVLRPGCVLTVEPGVYDGARNLGVRIEDTVVVTETGCEVLSADLPKSRAAVEALVAEDPWPSPVR